MTLLVSDIFLALAHEEILRLWLVIVLKLGPIKYPTIRLALIKNG